MRAYAIALIFAILLAGSASVSQAANSKIVQHEQVTVFVEDLMHNTLGSKAFTYDSTSPVGLSQVGPFSLSFALSYDSQPKKPLFSDVPLLPDVGKTVLGTMAYLQPNYSTFISKLRNGVDERLSGTFTLSTPAGKISTITTHLTESNFFPSFNKRTFKWKKIGLIGIRVDSASVRQVPIVAAAVPEPCAASVMLVGLTSTAVFWRRRRR